MKFVTHFLSLAVAVFAPGAVTASAQHQPRGGCSDPCVASSPAVLSSGCGGAIGCGQGYVVSSSQLSADVTYDSAISISSAPASQTLCEPTTSYRLVMQPTYVTESRAVCVQESRPETRYRTKTVYKTVPVTEEKYRTTLVNVPKTETKTITYSVLVPVRSEKTVEVMESVPLWSEEPEQYTVRVPTLVDVPEQYTVKVPQLRDETFTYTVNVPFPVTTQKMKTVVNAVPVTKSRTIQVCVPKTETQTVTKDYGHWEEQVIEVPSTTVAPEITNVVYGNSYGRAGSVGCSNRCGNMSYGGSGCGSACGSCGSSANFAGCGGGGVSYLGPARPASCAPTTITTTKRVWVPNVTTETVEVSTSSQESQIINYTVYEQQATQVPYECTTIAYHPETRTGTKQVVDYVDEVRTRMRKVVQYNEETRTRMKKTLTYNTVTKTETIPYVTYMTEERSKEISYTYNVPEYTVEPYQTTRYERVAEEEIEAYTVNVAVSVTKEQTVQVCKMVPTLVEETINPCCSGSSTGIFHGGPVSTGPSVMQGGCDSSPAIALPISTPVLNSGCGGCGATASASPCHGC